ncbi:MAG TPA: hypothetical protein VLH09_11265 [Bryobacteraceae bacterium]|nr:hypothetical protein [Bryobacteraceae bacterium]
MRFISITYRFFLSNLLLFLVLFQVSAGSANIWVGRAFFIWTSVFNLFVVSVFWAFMADLYTSSQGKRLFGFIAAAATAGGILGASVTATAVRSIGVPGLILIAAALLEVAVFSARRLSRSSPGLHTPAAPAGDEDGRESPIGGGVMAGLVNALRSPYLLGICLYMRCTQSSPHSCTSSRRQLSIAPSPTAPRARLSSRAWICW